MLLTIILAAVGCSILGGVILKLISDRQGWSGEITLTEFWLTAAAVTFVVAPLSGWVSYKVALSNKATYTQYLNGYETAADVTTTTCTRDGSCYWDYDCDPYQVY